MTVIISKSREILFNSAILATVDLFYRRVLNLIFGPTGDLVIADGRLSPRFFYAICVMALVQYIANTSSDRSRRLARSRNRSGTRGALIISGLR